MYSMLYGAPPTIYSSADTSMDYLSWPKTELQHDVYASFFFGARGTGTSENTIYGTKRIENVVSQMHQTLQ
jgi:hypothetical protein